MAFYLHGKKIGDDPSTAYANIPRADRRGIVYDYIREGWTLDALAKELASASAQQTGNMIVLDQVQVACCYLDRHRGEKLNFGGLTWRDDSKSTSKTSKSGSGAKKTKTSGNTKSRPRPNGRSSK